MWERRVQGKALSLIKVGFRETDFPLRWVKKKAKTNLALRPGDCGACGAVPMPATPRASRDAGSHVPPLGRGGIATCSGGGV